MAVGSVGASLLVIAWSRVTNVTAFYAIWAGLGACSAAVLYEPAFAVIAQRFTKRRSRALATVTFSAGLASTIFLPLSDGLLRAYGWRPAVLILGCFLAIMTIPLHALMLRRSPYTLGLLPDGAVNPSGDGMGVRHGVTLSAALHRPSFLVVDH
jgi:MFS family permease